jgi:hypothetical protein
MPWDLQYQPGTQTVYITVSGYLSEDEVRELVNQAVARLKQEGATKVLVDSRDLETGPSLAAIYWLVHDYSNLGAPHGVPVALIEPQKPEASELAHFYVLACANQRHKAELFATREAAEAWLRSAKPA